MIINKRPFNFKVMANRSQTENNLYDEYTRLLQKTCGAGRQYTR